MNEQTLFKLMRLEEALKEINEDLGGHWVNSPLSNAINNAFVQCPSPQLLLQITVPMHRFIARVAQTVIDEQIGKMK